MKMALSVHSPLFQVQCMVGLYIVLSHCQALCFYLYAEGNVRCNGVETKHWRWLDGDQVVLKDSMPSILPCTCMRLCWHFVLSFSLVLTVTATKVTSCMDVANNFVLNFISFSNRKAATRRPFETFSPEKGMLNINYTTRINNQHALVLPSI